SVAQVFREIAAVAVDDGIVFDPASVGVEEIRKEAGYGGVRVIMANWPRHAARRRSTSALGMPLRLARWTRSTRCSWATCLHRDYGPIPPTPSSRKSFMPLRCWA